MDKKGGGGGGGGGAGLFKGLSIQSTPQIYSDI